MAKTGCAGRWLARSSVALAIVLAAADADAGAGRDLRCSVREPARRPPPARAANDLIPQEIVCRLADAPPGLRAEVVSLRVVYRDASPLLMPAAPLEPYVDQRHESLTLVILAQHVDVLTPVRATLAKAGPARSAVTVLGYGDGAPVTRIASGDLASLADVALDAPGAPDPAGAPALLSGLDMAFAILALGPGRRVLVTIGDGTGEDGDIARALTERLDRFESASIELFSLDTSRAESNTMRRLGATAAWPSASPDELATSTAALIEHLARRIYLTFPCTLASAAACTGAEALELSLLVNGDPLDPPATSQLPPHPRISANRAIWSLWFIILPLLAIATILALAKRGQARSRNSSI